METQRDYGDETPEQPLMAHCKFHRVHNVGCGLCAQSQAKALSPDFSRQEPLPGFEPKRTSVLQAWVETLPFMQQTVLLTAVRGPDGMPKYGSAKMLLRWFRRCTLVSSLDGIVLTVPYSHANPTEGGSFMGASYTAQEQVRFSGVDFRQWEYYMDDLVSQYLKSLDALPHHFQLHFMHAAEIIGYKHPDTRIRAWWNRLYERLVHDMHLWPETEQQMDRRLGDTRAGWLARADPATQA